MSDPTYTYIRAAAVGHGIVLLKYAPALAQRAARANATREAEPRAAPYTVTQSRHVYEKPPLGIAQGPILGRTSTPTDNAPGCSGTNALRDDDRAGIAWARAQSASRSSPCRVQGWSGGSLHAVGNTLGILLGGVMQV